MMAGKTERQNMKNYKVSFYAERPRYNAIDCDAIHGYIAAENEAEAISLAMQYLHDEIDLSIAAACEIDEEAQEVTYYDKNGQIIECDYDFRAVEAAI